MCGLLGGGGYAQYAALPAGQCLPVPTGLSFTQAAALPETVFTVYHNVLTLGRLQPGERLLVHGGSSGIGTTAIQLAAACGAAVAVTVGSDEKGQACLQLGAEAYANYRTTDFETLGRFDVVLDMIGGEYFPKNIRVLNPGGRLVCINAMQGPKVELNLLTLMQQRLTLTGSTLRSREAAFKAELAAAVEAHVWPLLADGRLRPLLDSTFPLHDAAGAHRRLESSRHIGKIVLTVP